MNSYVSRGKKVGSVVKKQNFFLKAKKKLKSLLIDRHIKLLICNNSIYAQIYIGKNKIMLLHWLVDKKSLSAMDSVCYISLIWCVFFFLVYNGGND